MQYLIAMGGNIGSPEKTFSQALEKMTAAFSADIRSATYYWTKPLVHPSAPVRQQPYLNTVICFETDRTPESVLQELFAIECALGRVRANEQIPWGPRTIDLDMIAAEQLVLSTDTLDLPHPHMHKRDFVLLPMLELVPEWQHPITQQSLPQLIEALDEHSILGPLEQNPDQVIHLP